MATDIGRQSGVPDGSQNHSDDRLPVSDTRRSHRPARHADEAVATAGNSGRGRAQHRQGRPLVTPAGQINTSHAWVRSRKGLRLLFPLLGGGGLDRFQLRCGWSFGLRGRWCSCDALQRMMPDVMLPPPVGVSLQPFRAWRRRDLRLNHDLRGGGRGQRCE